MSLLIALVASQAFAGTPWECTVKTPITTTVIDTDGYQTLNSLPASSWDPTPLLATTIETTAAEGCITAQFSVHNLSGSTPRGTPVGDDYAAFVVLIDGLPMWGHISGCSGPAGTGNHCVVFAHNVDGATTVDGHSYEFFYPTVAGKHRIEVRYAGLDSTGTGPTGAYVGGSILTVQYE